MRIAWLLMAKAPVVGQVKTRLGHMLGNLEAACDLQDAFLADLLARPWQLGPRVLAWSGDPAHPRASEARARGWHVIAQRGQDLGQRMQHAFADSAALTGCDAVMTGSDIVDLPPQTMRWAARQVQAGRVAFVPAQDGGYVAIGWPAQQPPNFYGVRWSSPHTLADHVTSLRACNIPYVLGHPWADVDTVADLRRVAVHCARQSSLGARRRSVHTRAWLRRYAGLVFTATVPQR